MFLAAILTSFLALAGFGGAQGVQDRAQLCDETPSECRMVPAFSLRIGDKAFPVTFDKPQPWILNGRLYIFPGESVILTLKPGGSFSIASSQVASAVVDDAMSEKMISVFAPGGAGESATEADVVPGHGALKQGPPSQAIRVTFRQAAGSNDMLLTVQNGYGGRLAYDAGMLVPGSNGGQWRATSVCTTTPDLYGMEHWPHAIVSLSLGGFVIDSTTPADEIICR